MKLRTFGKRTICATLIFVTLVGQPQAARADLPSKPAVISFTMSQSEVELNSNDLNVTFDLVVNNSTGILSPQTNLILTDGTVNTKIASLIRKDFPLDNALQTVTFEATLNVSSLPAGAYSVSAAPITGMSANGMPGLTTDVVNATSDSKITGAKNSLLIRNNGDLNYSFATFQGPAFNKTLGISYGNPKFSAVPSPIWKVGEEFKPTDFYELKVPNLILKVASATPGTCSSNGITLKLIATGACAFTVFTEKTKDYRYFKDDQTVSISAGRIKPVYIVPNIPTQSSTNLPLSIPGPYVSGPLGLVNPISLTPSICFGAGTFINVISGGTCKLNYSTPENSLYLASDVYSMSFEITRISQSISFDTPQFAKLSQKQVQLIASSSSGLPIVFESLTPGVCTSVSDVLNLKVKGKCEVQAYQSGSPTVAPSSLSRSISIEEDASSAIKSSTGGKVICSRNGRSQAFSGVKCPVGYRRKI